MTSIPPVAKKDLSKTLTLAFERLSTAKDLTALMAIVAETARQISGADGTTFVLRDGKLCYYADENAISPLWKGLKFPIENCISGWSMIHQEPVLIPDIYVDNRIPHDAYRPTFVKSLCMIPIRVENPLGVIGNYWAESYVPTTEEVKSLQILANSTAVAIENLELRLVLTNQNSVTTGLANRNSELEVAINAMAHDLRSPVSGMASMADLLRDRLKGQIDAESVDFLQAIADTGKSVLAQVEQMLQLYRATNGQITKHELDLTKITNELIHVLKPETQNLSVQFNVQSDMKAHADPPLIRVVIANLLSNAIKYSSKKPQIKIDVGVEKSDSAFNTFYVRDNGDGFEPALANKLFQPSGRLHSYEKFAGTGLGLASVAKIIEVHGGECRAEGRPLEGATFYFSLPKDT